MPISVRHALLNIDAVILPVLIRNHTGDFDCNRVSLSTDSISSDVIFILRQLPKALRSYTSNTLISANVIST